MCGISGIWGLSDKKSIDKMLDAIKHRGPDDSGSFIDHNVTLGMVRLAIIDTTSHGHQPMISECGNIVIVYNGEVYNYREERNALLQKGYKFHSDSDTEVVLKLYEEYGDDFLTRLRGMFALAIYDKRIPDGRERLLLARDQFGIKPLFYKVKNGKVIFASELKAMIASGLIDKNINHDALRLLFTYGSIKQPQTILKDIFMLMPGHKFVIEKNGRITTQQFIKNMFQKDNSISRLSYIEQENYLFEALTESVRCQLVSDVPIGAFLSGGIDSSLITVIMSQLMSDKVKTFSVGFESEGSGIDESEDALKIADFLGTDHNRVIITGDDFKKSFLHIIKSLDQPSVDGVNSYFVSQAAVKNVTVSLSGTGGDELFAGYPWFVKMLQFDAHFLDADVKEKVLSNLFSLKIFDNAALVSGKLSGVIERYRSRSSFTSAFGRQYYINELIDINKIFTKNILKQMKKGGDLSREYDDIDELRNDSVLNRVSALCINGYLRNQLLRDIDVMSMTHSLEVRVPFIDPVILKIALSISDSAKVSNDVTDKDPYSNTYRELGTKKILINIGKKYLPKDYDLQPKRGFGMPFDHWMKNNISEYIEDALSYKSVVSRGFFSYEYVNSMYNLFKEGIGSWAQIWLFVVVEYWCREYID